MAPTHEIELLLSDSINNSEHEIEKVFTLCTPGKARKKGSSKLACSAKSPDDKSLMFGELFNNREIVSLRRGLPEWEGWVVVGNFGSKTLGSRIGLVFGSIRVTFVREWYFLRVKILALFAS